MIAEPLSDADLAAASVTLQQNAVAARPKIVAGLAGKVPLRACVLALMTLAACAPGGGAPQPEEGFAGLDANGDGALTSDDVAAGHVAVYLAWVADDGSEVEEGYDVEAAGVVSGGLGCNDEFCRDNPFAWSLDFQLPVDTAWHCALPVHQTEDASNPPPAAGANGPVTLSAFLPICTVDGTLRFGLPDTESAAVSLAIDDVDGGSRVSGTYTGEVAIHEGEGSAEEYVAADLPIALVLKGVAFRAVAF